MTCTLPVCEWKFVPATYTAWRPGFTVKLIDLDTVWLDDVVDEMPPPTEMPSTSTPKSALTVVSDPTVDSPPRVTVMSSDEPPQLDLGEVR